MSCTVAAPLGISAGSNECALLYLFVFAFFALKESLWDLVFRRLDREWLLDTRNMPWYNYQELLRHLIKLIHISRVSWITLFNIITQNKYFTCHLLNNTHMWPRKSELCLNTSKLSKNFSDFTPDPAFLPLKTCPPLCLTVLHISNIYF